MRKSYKNLIRTFSNPSSSSGKSDSWESDFLLSDEEKESPGDSRGFFFKLRLRAVWTGPHIQISWVPQTLWTGGISFSRRHRQCPRDRGYQAGGLPEYSTSTWSSRTLGRRTSALWCSILHQPGLLSCLGLGLSRYAWPYSWCYGRTPTRQDQSGIDSPCSWLETLGAHYMENSILT